MRHPYLFHECKYLFHVPNMLSNLTRKYDEVLEILDGRVPLKWSQHQVHGPLEGRRCIFQTKWHFCVPTFFTVGHKWSLVPVPHVKLHFSVSSIRVQGWEIFRVFYGVIALIRRIKATLVPCGHEVYAKIFDAKSYCSIFFRGDYYWWCPLGGHRLGNFCFKHVSKLSLSLRPIFGSRCTWMDINLRYVLIESVTLMF